MTTHDTIIFGGGLAGTLLAEQLADLGQSFLLVDEPQHSRCSRVAAGLINPIGGQRLKLVWMADTLIPFALARYQILAERYQTTFFHPRPLARLFSNDEERQHWAERAADPAYAAWIAPLAATQLPPAFANSDGFLVPRAGYLDTAHLLDTLHARLLQRGQLLRSTFNYSEISTQPGGLVRFRNYAARRVVFCEGHRATANPWFSSIPYKPAHGVIGSIAIDDPGAQAWQRSTPPAAIHQGKFLLPRHDGSIAIGATYDWEDRSDTPDAAGIQELETFLNARFAASWRWLDLKAGVRPATAGAYPVVGPHSELPQILACNGFGSKGSLQIPYFVAQLAQLIADQPHALPSESLPARFHTPVKPPPGIAPQIAKSPVLTRLQPGDTAIDATMGNGYDTHWLAQAVGPAGHVFAFDIQPQAIAATAARLRAANLDDRATLLASGHETLLDSLPPALHGSVAAVVFNLGYLPGGDKSLVTLTTTTLPALDASLAVLRPGGILAVTLYPAHQGGGDEAAQVLAWHQTLPSHAFATSIDPHPQGNPNSPFPLFAVKLVSNLGAPIDASPKLL